MQMTELWATLCELSAACGASNITDHTGCWEHTLGSWSWGLNPHEEACLCSWDCMIPAGAAWVTYEGRPVCVCAPGYGLIDQNSGFTEALLLARLQELFLQTRPPMPPPVLGKDAGLAPLRQAV